MTEPAQKLPGYDTAPDVYETPEVTSEQTNATQPSDASVSDSSSDVETEKAESDEDGPFGGISRKRLFPERARSRFQAVGNRVDTKGLDLSDRVDGRRRGLQVRQRRAGEQDGEEETLEARIARLRKEVEECRVLASDSSSNERDKVTDVDALGKMLAELESSENHTKLGQATRSIETNGSLKDDPEGVVDEQTLGKIAAFDGRLTALERALGISSMDIDAEGSFTAPVLPSLDVLDQQLSALMSATSIAQLDASSSRIKKLSQEADQLAHLQITPKSQTNGETEDSEETTIFSQDDMAKLNALYSLLPTLQGLSPTVPALLARLKSLTALHSGAAIAASELDDLVKKQAGMEAEIKSWEEGLERLEEVVKHALEANGRNGKTVEGWVKELHGRMAALR